MARKYAVLIEDGEIIAVEVRGVKYGSPLEIPDQADRAIVERLVANWERSEPGAVGMSAAMPKIIMWIFAGVSLLSLVLFAIATAGTWITMSREETARGYVIDMVTVAGSEGTQYSYPVVEYYLPDGRTVTANSTMGSYPPAYSIGQPVDLRYNPASPTTITIQSTGSAISRWTLSIISGVLASAFLAAALFARWIGESDQRPAL